MALVKFNILSRTLGRQVDVNAVVPSYTLSRSMKESFEQIYDPNRKYKLLMLLHGVTGDCNDYINYTNVVRYAEDNNFVVIIPSGFNSGYCNAESGEKYRNFIAEELVAVARYMFPVSDKYEDTYIAGLSMGAMGSAMIALAYPEVFRQAWCMSGAPSFIEEPKEGEVRGIHWFGEDPNVYHGNSIGGDPMKKKNTIEDAYFTAKDNIEKNKPMPKFTFTIGDKDFLLESTERFVKYMIELGYDVNYEIVAGYGHEWDFWDLKIREALYTGLDR